jgi:hypothetical protein
MLDKELWDSWKASAKSTMNILKSRKCGTRQRISIPMNS